MVLTNDETLAEKAGQFAQLNMRMTNFQATLLLNQLERFEGQIETRERNIAYLSKGMEAIDGLHSDSTRCACHTMVFLLLGF